MFCPAPVTTISHCRGLLASSFSPEWLHSAVQNENKFMCPCHGSQYNKQGKVIRGPAPLVSLLLQSLCLHSDKLSSGRQRPVWQALWLLLCLLWEACNAKLSKKRVCWLARAPSG